MLELFYMGGTLFMGILTLLLLIILCLSVLSFSKMNKKKPVDIEQVRHQMAYVKSIGLFAMVFGILGQLIGLYSAFQHIEAVKEVSANMLAGGLKVSSITSIYGMFIFLISYAIWFCLEGLLNKKIIREV